MFKKGAEKDEDGRPFPFVEAVIEWADSVELGSVTDMGEKIGEMLTEAMSPKVEAIDDDDKADKEIENVLDLAKKKEVEPPPSSQ